MEVTGFSQMVHGAPTPRKKSKEGAIEGIIAANLATEFAPKSAKLTVSVTNLQHSDGSLNGERTKKLRKRGGSYNQEKPNRFNLDLQNMAKVIVTPPDSGSKSCSSSDRNELVYMRKSPKSNTNSPIARSSIKSEKKTYLPGSASGIESFKTEESKKIDKDLANIEKKGDLTPITGAETFREVFVKFCFSENYHWFNANKEQLGNAQRFTLARLRREELFLFLIQNSGVLIKPIIERLISLKESIHGIVSSYGFKTKKAEAFYTALKELTARKTFTENGLEQGIILQEFLAKLANIRKNGDSLVKKWIERTICDHPEKAQEVIQYLVSWVDPSEALKKNLAQEMSAFDDLMILMGTIPNIKHTCTESEGVYSIEGIKQKNTLRSIKVSENTVLFETMSINGNVFYDETALPHINYSNFLLSRIPVNISGLNEYWIRKIQEQKIHAIFTWFKDRINEVPFYKKILFAALYHLLGGEEKMTDTQLFLYKRLENEDLGKLINLILKKESCDNFLVEAKVEILKTIISEFWTRSVQVINTDTAFFNQICYLMALHPWISRNVNRFGELFEVKEINTVLHTIKLIFSDEQVYREMFLGHYEALNIVPKEVMGEVDRYLKNQSTPLINIFRLYSVECFGFAHKVLQTVCPIFFKLPFFTTIKPGIKTEQNLKDLNEFSGSIIRKYSIARFQENVELAEIPVSWKIFFYKGEWKHELTYLDTFKIFPAATSEERRTILSHLASIEGDNNTDFIIESEVQEGLSYAADFNNLDV